MGLQMLGENSIDAIITDPPYGLSFMGKKWDYDVPSVEIWTECLRVLKPGGHLLAFAGTRTQHRMAVRIEDAGFEIRDMIAWVYGSGFPKSHNLDGDRQGWGTALKPALEPITVARKPLKGTVVANVLKHGTGALNIDGCRIETTENLNGGAYAETGGRGISGSLSASGMNVPGKTVGRKFMQPAGRWPANLIHDGSEEVLAAFPQAPSQQGDLKETGRPRPSSGRFGDMAPPHAHPMRIESDKSAARFFYCAKASKADRDEGLDGFAKTSGGMVSNTSGQHMTRRDDGYQVAPRANNHPTVKPTELMRYLVRLITPVGGIVLDPFAGSGSTGKAAALEGFRFFGFEREQVYADIANARIDAIVKSRVPSSS